MRQQLSYNGKKSVPVKFRKDLWDLMAIIELGSGQGSIGRSVFQKLREFRMLHELSWGDELLAKQKEVRTQMLSDQRANAIADFAAVLAGKGLGNLIDPHKGTLAKKGQPRRGWTQGFWCSKA